MKNCLLQLVMLCTSIPVFSQNRIYSVIGSSTAAGMGTSTSDSSWVNRTTKFYQQQGLTVEAHNLAVSGRNCYHGMPSSYLPPAGRDYPISTENITAALNFGPEVVIINYPTNNYNLYSISEIMSCLQTMKDSVIARGKTCYVTTSQPRQDGNFPDLTSRMKLKAIRDSVMNRFGNFAIDFYTDVTDPVTYQILPAYSYGDGVHLNDRGHAVLFEKVKAKNIFGSTPPPAYGCNYIIASPISGGINITGLTAPVDAIQLFNNNWATVYNQTFTNSPGSLTVSSLTPGTYHLNTTFYTSSWVQVCNKAQDVIVQTSSSPSPGNPNCNNITITATSAGISFAGLIGPIVSVQVMNNNWTTVYNQSYTNSPDNLSIASLAAGTYHISVTIYNSSWISICNKSQDVTIQASAQNNCNSVIMSAAAGGINLSGLLAPVTVIQIFNTNWTTVYNQTFTNLPNIITAAVPAGSYHVKVNFYNSSWSPICEKMQDAVVSTGSVPNYNTSSESGPSLRSMGMTVVPNPFVESIRIDIHANRNQNATIFLVDAIGRTVAEKKVTLQSGSNRFTLDGSRCSTGNYFLRVVTSNKVETIRLTRQ